MTPVKRWIVFSVLALSGAAADLASKTMVLARVPEFGEQQIIPGYFSFGHVYNEGIVFGKFQDAKKVWLIVSLVAVPAIVAIYASVKNPRWLLTITLGLILAGTLGNLYDRWQFGKVRDFIKFSYDADHVWPLFNLADAYICAGVLLLSLEMIFFDDKKKKKLQDEKAARATAAAAAAVAPAPAPPPAATEAKPVDPPAASEPPAPAT